MRRTRAITCLGGAITTAIVSLGAVCASQPAYVFISLRASSPHCRGDQDCLHETSINLSDDIDVVDGSSGKNMPSPTNISHQTRRNFAACISGLATVPIIAKESAEGLTPDQASQSYDTYAATYDKLDGGSIASSLGIDEARAKLLGQAKGEVLEIGVGTGLNLASYGFGEGGVTSLTLVDISEGMISEAQARVQQMNIDKNVPIKFVQADATSELVTIFGENKFDTVVDTFSLCVMGNEGAKKCLEEMARVVKVSGKILLVENTRSSNPLIGSYQDLTASSAADLGGKGCVYNQNVSQMISGTKGMRLEKEDSFAAGLFRSFECTKV
ncbi:hypothetical protein ACHAWC_010248 [Mediolabrus comicus]